LVSSEGTDQKGMYDPRHHFQSMLWQATSYHPSKEAGLPHSTNGNKLQYFQ